jgi:hypothetical protein
MLYDDPANIHPQTDAGITRRAALSRFARLGLMLSVLPRIPRARDPFAHPDPRPGITGDNVVAADQLPSKRAVRDAYEAARRSPEIFDGLYCVCDCEESLGHRSLLVCFESTQAAGCLACQDQAELAAKLLGDGKSLADIRAAFDRKWG